MEAMYFVLCKYLLRVAVSAPRFQWLLVVLVLVYFVPRIFIYIQVM